jgi:predicted transcriptional regulator
MEEKILKAMSAGEPMRPGDIAEAAGVSKDDVAKAIKKLVAEGKVYSPKRCFYEIKK